MNINEYGKMMKCRPMPKFSEGEVVEIEDFSNVLCFMWALNVPFEHIFGIGRPDWGLRSKDGTVIKRNGAVLARIKRIEVSLDSSCPRFKYDLLVPFEDECLLESICGIPSNNIFLKYFPESLLKKTRKRKAVNSLSA